MSYTKVSITLEPGVAEELRRVAGRRGLSAFVNESVRQQLQGVPLRRLLEEMEAESGPIPEEVRRRVDALDWPGCWRRPGWTPPLTRWWPRRQRWAPPPRS